MSRIAAAAIAATLPLTALAQPAGWNEPFPPHRVMDNLYYVGTSMLSSYLIATPEGDALVKKPTRAEVVVGRLELPAVRAFRTPAGNELPIDRIVDDGDTVSLGGSTLTAHLLPGHTQGCLAWSMQLEESGRKYFALIECSLNGQFLQYVGNDGYPAIVDDPNPFVDPECYQSHVDEFEQTFESTLARQLAGSR
jgi:metallo-beta-lactamase class B